MLIENELDKMEIDYTDVTEIRSKSGISVHRVSTTDGKIFILKCFENLEDRREISNYEILKALGIQTIEIIANTDCALLMEDIMQSPVYRLGIPEDMNDPVIMTAIAKWYKSLHVKGFTYVSERGIGMYDEADCITLKNIQMIAQKTETVDNPVWIYVHNNFEEIKRVISKPKKTLTYNDFNYTNFIVAKDKSKAFMFDYNLLGKGYVYADIRNVTYNLSGQAKAAFMSEYGEFDEYGKIIDDVASVIITLHFACNRNTLPPWASVFITQIENGSFMNAVKKLLMARK